MYNATKYIEDVSNYSINDKLKELCECIMFVLGQWSGCLYVGIRKDDITKTCFQDFFSKLSKLINHLITNEDNISSVEKEFINSIKYNGILYRYLGNGDCTEKRKIKLEYNGIFVSWSKAKENSYIRSKLYGKVIRLCCNTSNKYFGIDLENFQEFYNRTFNENCYISKGTEREVVFPTIEETISEREIMNN